MQGSIFGDIFAAVYLLSFVLGGIAIANRLLSKETVAVRLVVGSAMG